MELRGPAAILFMSRESCSDSIAKLFCPCFDVKRGHTCTFQACTLFSARLLALTASRLPSMPSSPPILSIASTLSEFKWAIKSPKMGQAMKRYHEEQSARSKGARLSPLDYGYCATIAQDVAKWGIAQICLCKWTTKRGIALFWASAKPTEKVSRDMGYHRFIQ